MSTAKREWEWGEGGGREEEEEEEEKGETEGKQNETEEGVVGLVQRTHQLLVEHLNASDDRLEVVAVADNLDLGALLQDTTLHLGEVCAKNKKRNEDD